MNATIAEQDALFFPYVNFPSEMWLKGTLLFSPHVHRIVARGYQPRRDTAFMNELRGAVVNNVPLLGHAPIWSETARQAQMQLLERLRTDVAARGDVFLATFQKPAARALALGDDGFQMHPGKLCGELSHDLQQLGLAWVPDHPDDHAYVEMHPAIGNTFLGAVAVACAADEGFGVIGDGEDNASQKLNRFASTCDFDALYDELILQQQAKGVLKHAGAQDVVDVILSSHCDPANITLQDLIDLGGEREPIIKLKARLQELAAQIPPMLNGERLQQRLEQCAVAALEEWEKDRPSFRGALKKFFGADLVKAGTDLLKGSIGKFVDGSIQAGSKGLPAGTGGLAAAHYLGPLGGFGVAIAVHGVTSVSSELMRGRASPYRYLSLAEKSGVVFSVGGMATDPAS